MNRITTFMDPKPTKAMPKIDSEGVLGYHLRENHIDVSTVLVL